MKDKIIINEVNVEKCLHRRFRHKIDICYRCAAYTNGFMGYCEDYPNCYYKQLKRKEQECEILTQENQEAKEIIAELEQKNKKRI